jgi:DNA mismatch repair protein MutL
MLARGKPLQRPVLVPPAVNIDKALLDAAEGELPALQALGLELRRIAPETVSVRQLPAFFDRVDMEQLATQVLSCWSMLGSDTGAETRLVNIHETVVEVLARCHARQSDWEAPQLDSLLGELDSIAVDADESNQVCVPLDEDVIKGLLRARG